MFAYGKKLLAPPVFPGDADTTRTARVLNTLVWGFILVLAVAAVVAPIVFVQERYFLPFILAFLAATVFAHLLLRRHHVRAASIIFVSAWWVALTVFIALAGGMVSPVAAYYLVCVVFAGLLLGTRAAAVTSLLSALAGLGMILIESNGDPIPLVFPVPAAGAVLHISSPLAWSSWASASR